MLKKQQLVTRALILPKWIEDYKKTRHYTERLDNLYGANAKARATWLQRTKIFSLFKDEIPLKTKQSRALEAVPFATDFFIDKLTLGLGVVFVIRPTKKEFAKYSALSQLSRETAGDWGEEAAEKCGLANMALFFVRPVNSKSFVGIIPEIHLRKASFYLNAGLRGRYEKKGWHYAALSMIEKKLSAYKIPLFIASPRNGFLSDINPSIRKRFYKTFPNSCGYQKHIKLVYETPPEVRALRGHGDITSDYIFAWAKK